MIYDFVCDCGYKAERNVLFADRDRQTCAACGRRLRRLSHIPHVRIVIPLKMQAKHQDDVREMLPDDREERRKALETVRANTGRWRHDLE